MVNKSNKTNKKSKVFLFGFLVILLSVIVYFGVKAFYNCSNTELKVEEMKIVSKDGGKVKTVLALEIADTEEARLNGLMNRKSLAENTGMLFDFIEPNYYSMWMKNTYVPLDMIFFNNLGEVISIAENREPLSEDFISPCGVEYEIKASQTPMSEDLDINMFYDECEERYLTPLKTTRYVIEVPAGTVRKSKIKVGDRLVK